MRLTVLLILFFSFCDSNFSLAALPAMVTKEELGKMLFLIRAYQGQILCPVQHAIIPHFIGKIIYHGPWEMVIKH
jgi:hypothetical protein